jgi:hypothetical protein
MLIEIETFKNDSNQFGYCVLAWSENNEVAVVDCGEGFDSLDLAHATANNYVSAYKTLRSVV